DAVREVADDAHCRSGPAAPGTRASQSPPDSIALTPQTHLAAFCGQVTAGLASKRTGESRCDLQKLNPMLGRALRLLAGSHDGAPEVLLIPILWHRCPLSPDRLAPGVRDPHRHNLHSRPREPLNVSGPPSLH